jgi:exopolyphosphatase/guanosine-5'-triphosphate,3'-diphosphate pyrophosphatase
LLPELRPAGAVGVAGTVTQLHELIGELTLARLETELGRLASMPLSERERLPRMDPARAPVIVAGTIVVVEILRRYGLAGLSWSVRDLLDGVAFEAAGMPAPPAQPQR